MITFLHGGMKTVKFLDGLLRIIPQEELSIVANTINNIEVCGLEVYPDIEYLLFLLAGRLDTRYWETVKNDTYSFMRSLAMSEGNDITYHTKRKKAFKGNTQEKSAIRLGDSLIFNTIYRDYLIKQGVPFSDAIRIIAEKMKIQASIVPVTDNKIKFEVTTNQGVLSFLEYRNQEIQGNIKEIKNIKFVGLEDAKVNPNAIESLEKAHTILIGPNNPPHNILMCMDYLNPFKEIKEAIETADCNVIAISPVVGDEPIDQPLKRLMEEVLGYGSTLINIAERYPGLIDTLIIDESDGIHKEAIEEMGMEVIVTPLKLGTQESREKLARTVSKLIKNSL